MNFSFPKESRLLKRVDFSRMLRRAKRSEGAYLILYSKRSRTDRMRLGMTVSRKFGNATQRNRCKRLLREAFRSIYRKCSVPCDLLIIPKKSAEGATLKEISHELGQLLHL